MKKKIGIAAILAWYAVIAAAVVIIIYIGGNYPSGSDTMCYLYKGDVLYQNICEGNWYPLYDRCWYNGVQMMRYSAPLPLYILALCEALAGGDALAGYLVFVAMVCFWGAVGWLSVGVRKGRTGLGAFLGALWFFMPNNLYTLFGEGNLSYSLLLVLLPLLIFHIHEFLMENRWQSLKKIILLFVGIALCHVGYAGMIALALLIFLGIYKLLYPRTKKCLTLILSLVLPFALIGIWLCAFLKGGITSTDSSQVMKNFFQDAWISLNPFYRYESNNVTFYFGLAAFVLAVFGAVCSRRKSLPGFWSAVIIFVCTMTSMYPLLEKLPGSQYLYMLRFISIALCMILYSFLIWDTLKKPFVWIICALLVVDVIPSVSLFYTGVNDYTAEENLDALADAVLIDEAREITTQRVALLDGSSMGATAPYLISGFKGQRVQQTFGAGWQSVATAGNIVQLNEATAEGAYWYLFDRALELGNDTVLVQVAQLKEQERDMEKVTECAAGVGYELIDANSGYLLYHMDTYETFGTISSYDAIGIGSSASLMSLLYPAMQEADSDKLDDYTFEELVQYQTVYLDHFTYDDKETSEELVTALADAGVRVVINADGTPTDERLKMQEFLGVTCSSILFENGYPLLYTDKGEVDCALFESEYAQWETVYLNGLDKVTGRFYDNGMEEAFLGTVHNDNIVFVGLNLGYHYLLTRDAELAELFDELFGLTEEQLPNRMIVPLTVTYGANEIVIESEYDEVNTALAYHDIFESDQEISSIHALTYVNKGTTVITMHYPYLAEGIMLSILGIALTIAFLRWVRQHYGKEGEDGQTDKGK